MDALQFMLMPFLASLILTGIHGYLGMHILSREVIFVDLALAQIAALGTTFAFLAGYSLYSTPAYLYSLLFTFLGAAIFSLTRTRERRVSQEAIIGTVYVVSAATAILVIDRAPQGAEHIKYMLIGSILTVSKGDVLKTFLLYSLIGLFHWVFREKFITISFEPEKAYAQGTWVRLWDFLFYASFGFVVTSSVRIAGVLLVFTYLIVPAICSLLFTEWLGARLAIAWALGFLVSIVGLYASYVLDLPTGAAIVCAFGLALIASALLSAVVRRGIAPVLLKRQLRTRR